MLGDALWLPRVWTWLQVRQVLWFRGGLAGKARDFNWHNVIGIWSAIPLAIVVAGAVPISYQWAGALVYEPSGRSRRSAAAPGGRTSAWRRRLGVARRMATPRPTAVSPSISPASMPASPASSPTSRLARDQHPGAPGARAPLTLTVDEGYGGQPQHRGTVTPPVAPARSRSGSASPTSAPAGASDRFRFAHTGEFYGLPARPWLALRRPVASCWSGLGLALTLRRFLAWRVRRRRQPAIAVDRAA